MNEKYNKLTENLRKACNFLKWEFALDSDAVSRCEIDDGVAFTLDKVEYVVGPNDIEGSGNRFYASIMVQYHGNREEPPSEDQLPLEGPDLDHPEHLISRILQAHWKVRFNWVMESLVPEEQG